ncbi:MAG: hypothetical protein ACRCUY_14125 [Thermoguttaceae bacterium]
MNTSGVRGRIPMPNKTRELTLAARQNTPPNKTADSRRRLAKIHPPTHAGSSINKTRERILLFLLIFNYFYYFTVYF